MLLKPVLIFGIGNPSRGDDALGPMLVERLAALALPDVDLLTDFQLQVEHACDLLNRRAVIFADASVSGPGPYVFSRLESAEDTSYSSHALSPAAVLHAYRQLYGEPPPAWTLAMRGHAFDLGDGLSPQAASNLEQALAELDRLLAQTGQSENTIRPESTGRHDGIAP